MYGIRIVIGYGKLETFDRKRGIIDGEAIYLSGRFINQFSTSKKERITIKQTLFFLSSDQNLNEKVQAILFLLDFILSKATTRQSEILFLKLLGQSEIEIAKKLNVSQSSINQSSTSVGWNEIENSILYLEKIFND